MSRYFYRVVVDNGRHDQLSLDFVNIEEAFDHALRVVEATPYRVIVGRMLGYEDLAMCEHEATCTEIEAIRDGFKSATNNQDLNEMTYC